MEFSNWEASESILILSHPPLVSPRALSPHHMEPELSVCQLKSACNSPYTSSWAEFRKDIRKTDSKCLMHNISFSLSLFTEKSKTDVLSVQTRKLNSKAKWQLLQVTHSKALIEENFWNLKKKKSRHPGGGTGWENNRLLWRKEMRTTEDRNEKYK